jgi:DNA-binding MarR family transcriptional regulator
MGEVLQVAVRDVIPMALRAAYLALHRESEARFKEFGVTADQFVLLATLARGEALTQRVLARRMSSDPSTVGAMLVLLEKRGLVRRDDHPTDARARVVSLTSAGHKAYRQLWAAGETIRESIIQPLDAGEAKLLVTLLRKVAAALHQEAALAGAATSTFSKQEAP